jgi:hypothetical protein
VGRVIFGGKYAGETSAEVFDFASLLAVGETLSTATVTAAVYSGTDASPSGLIFGAATISGSQVRQTLIGGVLGVTYVLTAQVTTSAGQTLQLSGYLAVMPAAA